MSLDLEPIKQALEELATLDDPDAVMPFVDYCEALIAEVERLRAQCLALTEGRWTALELDAAKWRAHERLLVWPPSVSTADNPFPSQKPDEPPS